MTVVHRFDAVARLIEAAARGASEEEAIAFAAEKTHLPLTRIKGLLLLSRELGFIEGKGPISPTQSGQKFANYMSVHRREVAPDPGVPKALLRPIDYQVCMTLPPAWRQAFRSRLGELVQETVVGERIVAEQATRTLYVVSAYLDHKVLQMKLQDFHAPEVSVTVLTSDPHIAREYEDGNWKRRRLFEILERRFKDVQVYHFHHKGMIAHAKVWVSEGGAFVTSANLAGDSAADNLEVGLYSSDPGLTRTLILAVETALHMEGVTRLDR